MCGFYANEQKIQEGDVALLEGQTIQVLSAKHVRATKSMDILYREELSQKEHLLNFPYKTITALQLLKRETKHNEL